MERVPVMAGNWKMNTTAEEGVELIRTLKSSLADVMDVHIVIAPPFTHLNPIGELINGSNIALAAQNMFAEDSGAYTGEISPLMIKAVGCQFVIIGHSERRQFFGDTDTSVNEKAKAALNHNITPIVCIGETLAQRESKETLKVILGQLKEGLRDLPLQEKEIIIAYEPVWAIGTGKTATAEQAQEVHSFIRKTLEDCFGQDVAVKTRIIYGGSVKPENASNLMGQPDIDGALVGGASLSVDSFEKIVKFNRS